MKLYAGFEGGKIATTTTYTEDGHWDAPEIFDAKKTAKKYYKDVREVEIVEVKKL